MELAAGEREPTNAAPTGAPPATPTKQAAPERDPAALAALEQMGKFLRSLDAFSVRGEATTDEVLESGQKLQFAKTIELWVRRPDRLRAKVASDRKEREFFYDGKTFTLYGQRMGYYAQFDAPKTIRELIEVAESRYGIEFPFVDLFYWGTEEASLEDIRSALDIGPSRIGDVEVGHYAYQQDDVDFQLWIQRGEKPLPLKYVITTKVESSEPQHSMLLSWNLHVDLKDRHFTFVPPKGANRIVFDVAQP